MAAQRYRLGLDIGTNSIGWCAVELDDNGNATGILDSGVRIFRDGRNPKDGTSLAAMRREPRAMRRRRDRYLKRREQLLDQLTRMGLMPADEAAREQIRRRDPYRLRAEALDQPLTPHELGRALFHLNQRRGFRSNRKADAGDENSQGQRRQAIAELHARMAESGARTLGEYLDRRHRKGKLVRAKPHAGFYPDRGLYEAEFDAIRAAQEAHQALHPADWETLRDTIFFQRSLHPVDPGRCTLEPEKPRAPWALPEAQRFRIVQEVNNLRVEPPGAPPRHLSHDEREKLLTKLTTRKEVKFDSLAKQLGLPAGTRFNLWDEKRSALKGDETAAVLSAPKRFGKQWHKLSQDRRTEIVRALLTESDRDALVTKAMNAWGLPAEAAGRVADATLPSGYARFCEDAIAELVPIMREQGLTLAEAVAACPGYAHHSDFRRSDLMGHLPYYGAVLQRHVVGGDPHGRNEVERYGRIANPTVHIGLNQLRRVVNKLIRTHGRPQEVVVELARELKQSAEDRQRVQREQRRNQDANARRAEDIRAAGQEPSGELLRKLRLWEEQGPPQARVCPYTGTAISFRMVLSEETEIDHILPFSRTLDDSMANRVVCMRRANRRKGDRTPYEAFAEDGDDVYAPVLDRAAQLPANKRWRFQPDAMQRFERNRDFLDRHLNETKYLSRIASQYLAHISPRVRAVPGTLTGLLRGKWGLNGLLGDSNKKDRTDHRHHAIDAFVVAMTTQGMLQAVANAAERPHAERDRLIANMPRPWEGFTPDDVRAVTDRMVVSHKPDHGTPHAWHQTTGALHNDMAHGIERQRADGRYEAVHRTPVDSFGKRKQLERVKDPALRTQLLAVWDRTVGAGERPAAFARAARDELNVRRVRVVETISGAPIRDRTGTPYKLYKTDANEFLDVFRTPDGRWRAEAVSRFRANQPNAEPGWRRRYPAAKKLARLHVDDLIALGTGGARRIYRVVKISGANATLAEAHEGGSLKARDADQDDLFQYVHASPTKLRREGFRRLRVDELGHVRDPGPLA